MLDRDAERVWVEFGYYRFDVAPHAVANTFVGEVVSVAARPKGIDGTEELFAGLDTTSAHLLPFHTSRGGEHRRVGKAHTVKGRLDHTQTAHPRRVLQRERHRHVPARTPAHDMSRAVTDILEQRMKVIRVDAVIAHRRMCGAPVSSAVVDDHAASSSQQIDDRVPGTGVGAGAMT